MTLTEVTVSDTLVIKEIGNDQLEEAFPVISQLRTHLSFSAYCELVKIMKDEGYRIICLFESGKIVSYAGFAKLVNLYYGEHVWVYDLVTDKAEQGKGYARLLLSYIDQYARDNSLNCVALSSRFHMEGAHKFYEEAMNYKKTGYVFKRDI